MDGKYCILQFKIPLLCIYKPTIPIATFTAPSWRGSDNLYVKVDVEDEDEDKLAVKDAWLLSEYIMLSIGDMVLKGNHTSKFLEGKRKWGSISFGNRLLLFIILSIELIVLNFTINVLSNLRHKVCCTLKKTTLDIFVSFIKLMFGLLYSFQ